MATLTEKQAAFVANKVAGMTNEAAAIAAGYARGSAAQAATGLMKVPKVKAAIAKGKREAKVAAEQVVAARKVEQAIRESHNSDNGDVNGDDGDNDDSLGLKDSYDSPLDFMEDCMNNPRLTFGPRFEAAKQALPYRHAKRGEAGKKQTARERAEAHTKGEGTSVDKPTPTFSPMQPPPRKVN